LLENVRVRARDVERFYAHDPEAKGFGIYVRFFAIPSRVSLKNFDHSSAEKQPHQGHAARPPEIVHVSPEAWEALRKIVEKLPRIATKPRR
jgi:hypothetical protein